MLKYKQSKCSRSGRVDKVSYSQITKKALAESMKELMLKYPVKKISVKDIAEGCSLNRQSFYYHFRDKYDLINWIYYTEFVSNVDKLSVSSWDILLKTCDYFYENKKFYRNAFQENGQNSFSEYFIEVLHPILFAKLRDVFKNNKNVEFYVSFYEDAIRASISRWLIEESDIKPDQFVKLLKKAVEVAAKRLHED